MHSTEKKVLDKVIISGPSVGEVNIGDLGGIQVYKYKLNTQQYLVAYQYVEEGSLLAFVGHGAHENFYRIP